MYIDIHNHTLFGVDDGPDDIEESIEMLRIAKAQEIDTIIITPHYRHGMFPYDIEAVEANFGLLKNRIEELGIEINLLLGCEYYVDSNIFEHLESGRCKSLAGTDYILTEYSYSSEYSYIKEQTKRLTARGYIPVIAHIERYGCIAKKPQLAKELAELGAFIQINADSVLGIDGKILEKVCKKLLKQGLADIVASDTHGMSERKNHMDRCYKYIAKKYGDSYADRLFIVNPKKIVEMYISQG